MHISSTLLHVSNDFFHFFAFSVIRVRLDVVQSPVIVIGLRPCTNQSTSQFFSLLFNNLLAGRYTLPLFILAATGESVLETAGRVAMYLTEKHAFMQLQWLGNVIVHSAIVALVLSNL